MSACLSFEEPKFDPEGGKKQCKFAPESFREKPNGKFVSLQGQYSCKCPCDKIVYFIHPDPQSKREKEPEYINPKDKNLTPEQKMFRGVSVKLESIVGKVEDERQQWKIIPSNYITYPGYYNINDDSVFTNNVCGLQDIDPTTRKISEKEVEVICELHVAEMSLFTERLKVVDVHLKEGTTAFIPYLTAEELAAREDAKKSRRAAVEAHIKKQKEIEEGDHNDLNSLVLAKQNSDNVPLRNSNSNSNIRESQSRDVNQQKFSHRQNLRNSMTDTASILSPGKQHSDLNESHVSTLVDKQDEFEEEDQELLIEDEQLLEGDEELEYGDEVLKEEEFVEENVSPSNETHQQSQRGSVGTDLMVRQQTIL